MNVSYPSSCESKSYSGYSSENFVSRSDALRETVRFLNEQPEYKEVKKAVGSVKISLMDCGGDAKFDLEENRIVVDPSQFVSKFRINEKTIYPGAVQMIFFEMCNFEQKGEFLTLIGRASKLTADEFIEEFEKLEYRSALKAKQFVRRLFPRKDWLNTYANVSDHFGYYYLMQQSDGHSRAIYEHYKDQFPSDARSYHGTWKKRISEDEQDYVKALVLAKGMSLDADPQVVQQGKKAFDGLAKDIVAKAKGGSVLFSRLEKRINEIQTI